MAFSRGEILRRLREQVAARKPIIGCGAGTGISAKFAEAGGADLLIIYNSGRYRMAGRSSLAGFFAYGDANSIVMEMAGEVLPVVRNTPVLAGVNGTDPFKVMPHFLQQVKAIGFSGVQNFPTMGMFDGIMRANMEATGLGYDKEVAMIRMASEIDLFTSPYVFNADEARAMVQAGADLIVCHVGLTTAGSIGASVAMTLDEAVEKTMVMAEAVWKLRKDALVICHGGPFDEPENVKKALKQMPGIAGFYGASSVERLPTERAIRSQVTAFKQMAIAPARKRRRAAPKRS
ncbi:phosphoenolpyruvate hydrolase family protein [Kamptonema cortianum]|nr:phosphoenolpyruvate hydrolase family protein [Kamptonema cortianum]